ncbi:hypothetical protein ACRYCC_36585 [Actinomadura scrupuli]|uniref:hypothetical protein n=1 Tax=Actinomadura scrupuli TaxID=559629 RepID=UPI003D96F3AF
MVAHLEETVAEQRFASARLEELAGLLCAAGLYARVNLPIGRPPSLHVVNPAAPGLEEHVVIERRDRGEWWLRWSWAEEIAPAGELDRAVDTIRRVLGVSA